MKKMLFVMNPYAGVRRANRLLPDVIGIFNRAGYEVIAHMTAGRGDATEVVAARAADMDMVVCCGGDGTFSETVSGLLKAGADVPVGFIPAGSTNDFAISLELSTNILQAAQDIVQGTPIGNDVGRFGEKYFSYVASFGAFTKASYSAPQNVKNTIGHLAYLLEGSKELSQIRNVHVRLELDGQVVEDDFLFGAVSNSTSYAGIVSLNRNLVDLSDGEFEVLLVRAPRSLAEITECIQAIQEQKYNCAMITFRRARFIRVYADPEMPWTLDGERSDGQEMVEIENLHTAIRLMKRV